MIRKETIRVCKEDLTGEGSEDEEKECSEFGEGR